MYSLAVCAKLACVAYAIVAFAQIPRRLQHRQAEGVPDFVTKYAPIVHLYSKEQYLPSDIGAQLENTTPYINYTAITTGAPSPLTLDNLNDLDSIANSSNGHNVYLTSISDPTTDPRPSYLYGVTPDAEGKTENAVSSAIITASKADGVVDVFYFYFYAFNYGGDYVVGNIGNHVGDWEHNAIRFVNGTPTQVYYSQHSAGEAFEYQATEKYSSGVRPVGYSAEGTHANYATPGDHDHAIPGVNLPVQGFVTDYTDAGPVWDPTLSAYYYDYDVAGNTFTAYGDAPVSWLYYLGQWGDDQYPEDDPRQHCDLDINALCQYTGGPTGPIDKDLARSNICPDGDECNVLPVLVAKKGRD